ncbi:MAG: hypothetical protein HFE39_04800 [Clostridiales bacterium]|jgi:hypothetical protein|nr:hypothetical protein [Clostridiales bacterium]
MKLKYMWIAFTVFLLVTVPFRIYQTVALIDPQTNFYEKGTEFTLTLLLGLLGLYVVTMLVMSAMHKGMDRHTVHKNIPAGIFALVAGGLLLVESGVQLVGAGANEKMVESVILGIAALLAAVTFFFMAASSFAGRNLFERMPLLALLTTLWGCARLVITFLGYTNIASDSSSMFDMVGIMFALLFLFTQAKLFAGVGSEKTSKRLFLLGMLAIVFICVFNIPELVQHSMGSRTLEFSALLPRLIDLSLAFYIFCILLEMSKEYILTGGWHEYHEPVAVEGGELPLSADSANPDADNLPKPEFFDSLVADRPSTRDSVKKEQEAPKNPHDYKD